jgi:hypothetical protein
MSGSARPPMTETELAALHQGRGEGLALAALSVGIVAFINLVGAEKGILAVVLGVLATRRAVSSPTRRRGRIAVILGVVQLVTVVGVLIVFREKIAQLLDLLRTLS